MPASILVIEDSRTNLALTTFLLEEAGYRVLTAQSGEAGIAVARAERPDLVLCDIYMPTIDGYEVARIFAGDAELSRIPIIAFTAREMAGDQNEIIEAGFRGYVPKPITPGIIADQIHAYLANGLRPSGPGTE